MTLRRLVLLTLVFAVAAAFRPVADRAAAGQAAGPGPAEPHRLRLACATFPAWLFTRNVTAGIALFEVDLVLPAITGCPHDYEPSPQDVRKVATADALVIVGLGFDNKLVPVPGRDRGRVPASGRGPVVIDASRRDQPNWIRTGAAEGAAIALAATRALLPGASEWQTGPVEPAHPTHACDGHDCDHDHGEWNPHYFASPDEAALAAVAILKGIVEHFGAYLNQAQHQRLQDNTKRFADDLKRLSEQMRDGVRRLPNRRIVTFHDAFDYFARDLGLQVVGVLETHPGVEPAPAEFRRIVDAARRARAGGVFTEPQYDPALALMAAAVIGVGHGLLDPVASGPADAPLDHYQKTMRANLAQLAAVLGAVAAPD